MHSRDDHSEPDKRRRVRFSLLNLMLAMTILAMAGTIWQLAPLYFEVKKLREETGQLVVWNRSKVHAIQVPTYQEHAWKWRLWVPRGQKLRVSVLTAKIPSQGFPSQSIGGGLISNDEIDPCELVITLSLNKQLDGALLWNLTQALSDTTTTTRFLVPTEATDWLIKGSSGASIGAVGRTTRKMAEVEPLVLLRERHFYGNSGQTPPPNQPETTDGIMVWITEK